MTIERKIKLLEAMEENNWSLHDIYLEAGETEKADKYEAHAVELMSVIQIMKDNEYAEDMAKVFEV